MKDRYLFLHLYKTGGQTLRNVFTYQTPAEQYFDIGRQGFDDFLALQPEAREKIRLIFGHIKFGMDRFFDDPGSARYLTMLRDPVARMLSLHRYVNQHPGLDLHRAMPPEERVGLGAFIRHIDRYSPYHGNNGMSKAVAGVDRGFPADNLWDRRIANPLRSEDLLATAWHHLETRFAAVGILEHFNESLALYKRVLGWKKPLFYQQRNASRQGPAERLDPETLAELRARNQADIALYDRGLARFRQDLEARRPAIRRELRRVRFNNRIYGVYRRYYRDHVRK